MKTVQDFQLVLEPATSRIEHGGSVPDFTPLPRMTFHRGL